MLSGFALLAAIACGDDDGSGPTGSISVTASPTSLTLAQGASGTVTVTLTRGGGFSEAVTVTVEGLPAGVTASVAPTQLTGTTTSAVVTVNVASTVPAGTYPVTVRASATGIGAATATYSLIVTAVTTPNYSLTATPAAVSAGAGGSATSTIAIQRTNFTGAIALTLDNPPAGITGSFNPTPVTADQSVLTINVGSTVAAGSYNLTVKGSATGPGDKTTTVALTVTAAATFTISATPAALNIAAGASGNTSVAIVRTNFTTDVALSLVSPPAGITGVFTPATLTGTTLTSTLALSVASNVAAGTYPITVRGTAGAVTQNTIVNVTVTAAAAATLAVSPTTLTIQQGGSGTATLTATRTNFTGDITPSVSGAPAGMTVTFNPTALTGSTLTSTATVNVGSGVAAGNYTLTITGGGAPANPTTTLTVTVTAPSGGNIVWEFCNTPNNVPLKFWRLSGGTWTEITGTVVGSVTRFSFSVSAGSTGIAYTASASGFSTTIVYFAQSTELASFAAVCATPTTVQKTFNLSGQVGGEVGQLGYGGAAVVTGAAASYNLTVAPGTYDWLWAFGTQSGVPPTTDFTTYRIGRNEATTSGAVSVNRAGAPAFVTAPFSFTGGAAGSLWQTSQSLSGANGQVTTLSIGSILTGNGSGNMLFLQPGDRLSTDLWLLSGTNLEIDQNGKGDSRTSSRYVGSAPPGSLTFALPGKVPAFTVTSSSASIPWNAAGSIPAEYQTSASTVSASFSGAGGTATATLIATRAWLVANNMSTSYTLTGPTLPNFLPAWAPGSPLSASSVIMAGTNLTGPPTAGGFLNTAVRIQ